MGYVPKLWRDFCQTKWVVAFGNKDELTLQMYFGVTVSKVKIMTRQKVVNTISAKVVDRLWSN